MLQYTIKILYFYSISKHNDHPQYRYHLRVLSKDDIVLVRDKKIDDILGE